MIPSKPRSFSLPNIHTVEPNHLEARDGGELVVGNEADSKVKLISDKPLGVSKLLNP